MKLGPRQYVVLRILSESKAPVRACDLWRRGNEEVLFRKESGERFWKEDMATMMKSMVKRGLVQYIPYPGHAVFYALTQCGYEALLEKESPQKLLHLRKLTMERLLFKGVRYYNPEERFKENREQIITAAKLLPQLCLSEVLVKVFGKAKGLLDYSLSQSYDRVYYQDQLKQTLNVFNELLGILDEELRQGTETAMQKVAEEVFIERHQRNMGRRATIVRKALGNCMFCGSEIHNEDACKDEQLLKKFAGTKTGLVCCGCFGHLKWIEEHLVGIGGKSLCET